MSAAKRRARARKGAALMRKAGIAASALRKRTHPKSATGMLTRDIISKRNARLS